jgi:hypothetical protein
MVASVVTSQNWKLKNPLDIAKCLSFFDFGNIYYLPLNYTVVFKLWNKWKESIARRIGKSRTNPKGKGITQANPNPMAYQRT